MRRASIVSIVFAVLALGSYSDGQTQRPPSPAGSSAAQVGGMYKEGRGALKEIVDPKVRVLFATRGPIYEGGKWIEITSGRPLKRGRDLWGSGQGYGEALYAGAPIWRAGAQAAWRVWRVSDPRTETFRAWAQAIAHRRGKRVAVEVDGAGRL